MRIAMIDPSLFTLPYDECLIDALARHGCRVEFYGRMLRVDEVTRGQVALIPFFYRRGERIMSRGAQKIIKGVEHVSDMLSLRAKLRRDPVDIVHFQWTPVPALDHVLVPLVAGTKPRVLTVHDLEPFNNSPGSRLQIIGARNVPRIFDHLIVHSAATRDALINRGLDPKRISVIPHGLLPVTNAPLGDKPAGDRVNILMFGKVRASKGVDALIRAFALMPTAAQQKARIVVVGEPLMAMDELRALALKNNVPVEWDLRYVHDREISAILTRSDILAFPYTTIDTSGVLMMTLPFGKPIVASDIGVFAQLLRNDEHGYLVPPNSPPQLATALAKLIENPQKRDEMGQAVRRLQTAIPAWDDIAAMTVDVYRRLVPSLARSSR